LRQTIFSPGRTTRRRPGADGAKYAQSSIPTIFLREQTVSELASLIDQLGDSRSPKRRAAAKKLRVLADPRAASALRAALQKEVKDRRTWETQYQMIMALAACHSGQDEASLFQQLLTMPLEPMVHMAASDAMVRVSKDVDAAVLGALRSGSLSHAEGAVRALAMMRWTPADPTIEAVIRYAEDPAHKQMRFWVVAAAAGWNKAIVRAFLEERLQDEGPETRRAAEASLQGHYLRWNPL
jgi:hypothetical protein